MTTSWLKLAHKTCIVTGAGSGIGAAGRCLCDMLIHNQV